MISRSIHILVTVAIGGLVRSSLYTKILVFYYSIDYVPIYFINQSENRIIRLIMKMMKPKLSHDMFTTSMCKCGRLVYLT